MTKDEAKGLIHALAAQGSAALQMYFAGRDPADKAEFLDCARKVRRLAAARDTGTLHLLGDEI
ncbi:MAG TPA: hypothetical protein DIW80_03855 [Gordonia polyisoprenivorans]|uniref:hypothetical protein n=1 Tax=Gordonia polyisoprenivorans TaxID=84595 RepID=UPI000EDE7BA8|nr:hypothetical protein LH935_16365 [Gordonia polyisoprenivorans]HCS56511.1 hypothetical protein [Gordonia polyisoprenivorans]